MKLQSFWELFENSEKLHQFPQTVFCLRFTNIFINSKGEVHVVTTHDRKRMWNNSKGNSKGIVQRLERAEEEIFLAGGPSFGSGHYSDKEDVCVLAGAGHGKWAKGFPYSFRFSFIRGGKSSLNIWNGMYLIRGDPRVTATSQTLEGLDSSHLCGNPCCLNAFHIRLESGFLNKSRCCFLKQNTTYFDGEREYCTGDCCDCWCHQEDIEIQCFRHQTKRCTFEDGEAPEMTRRKIKAVPIFFQSTLKNKSFFQGNHFTQASSLCCFSRRVSSEKHSHFGEGVP